jgi:hypothetical protein
LFGARFAFATPTPDEPAANTVGAIEGESISVEGPMNVEVMRGQVRTVLKSGSDIRVKSGQAQIALVEGGGITICGPAHFSVLKSAGSLTIALDTGTIHARIENNLALTVYTAQIQAKPMAIAGTPQDVLVGFDSARAMVVRSTTGAVRVEQQLTGQSVIVPQGGDILVMNGQLDSLRSGAGRCVCNLQLARIPAPRMEVSRLATTEEIQKAQAETKKSPPAPEKPATTEESTYQVFMPPLSYDANAKVQADNYDPNLILLVRRVRVRPTLIFQGKVEGEAVAQNNSPAQPPAALAPKPAKPAAQPDSKTSQKSDSMVDRVRAFFHRVFS